MKNFDYKKLLITSLLMVISSLVIAGTSCKRQEVKPGLYLNASKKAIELKKTLDRLDPQVALIARVGTDLRQYGLHYSHLAFVVKNYQKSPGKWTVIHLLNKCDTPYSSLYKQGLMNFFLDDLYTLEYQINIPNKATQTKLYQLLQADKLHRLHNKHYSMLAYPFSTKYQNSNQWVLEVVATALSNHPLVSGNEPMRYLLKTHYKPSVIKITAFAKLGASLFSSHIQFDDHPQPEQRANRYSTVTVSSVINYLRRYKIIN